MINFGIYIETQFLRSLKIMTKPKKKVMLTTSITHGKIKILENL